MCGIGGLAGDFVPGLMTKMNEAQSHRGPDGQGSFEDPRNDVALGHVRLAILDLSDAAAQPMYSPDGRFVLVYNGEIYNFSELREELIPLGHQLKSTGDTEVLLCGLSHFGLSFIRRLNGIFAFALWDRKERTLCLARDQMGVKPLYYAEPKQGTLLFASEIKALFVYPNLKREPDFDALQQHLAYCHASDQRTAIKGVHRLAPGHILQWDANSGKAQVKRFWQLPFGEYHIGKRNDAIEELRDLIRQATIRQLVSDVPVGAFLSGGVDSSYITSLAAENLEGLRCFTVKYPRPHNKLDNFADDLPYAQKLATDLGLELSEIDLLPNLAELWPKLIYHLDEPIADPACIASFLMCKLAREKSIPVLLSGQGGDELFCGYPRYLVMHSTEWLKRIPLGLRRMFLNFGSYLPGARESKAGAMMRRIRRVSAGFDLKPEERFLSYCANSSQKDISYILSPEFKSALNGSQFNQDCLLHMESQELDGLQKLQERDLSIYLPNHNLLYTDKMSMAVGVEARVPLLDLELVNRVVQYPYEWLLARGKTKVLFREAARTVLPKEIIDRPKAGLGAPYRKWLRYDLQEMWNELTSESSVRNRGWFDFKALKDVRARSQAGRDDLYMLQWAVLTIELWARQFIDRNPCQVFK